MEPADGGPPLPKHLCDLISHCCGKGKTSKLPCAKAAFHLTPHHYEHVWTHEILQVQKYFYGSDQQILVASGKTLAQTSIINYIPGVQGEIPKMKLYGIWKGTKG